jgi:hypothetical protein
MKRIATLCQLLTRGLGPVMILLGVLFWTGNALTLIPVHMLIGLLIVLILWVVAALAALARANPGLVLLGVVWGLVVPALGVTQAALLPGDWHWLVRVLHLAVGLVALGLIEQLARRVRSAPALPAPALAAS